VVSYFIKMPSPNIVLENSQVSQPIYTINSQKSDMLSEIDTMWIDFPDSFLPTAKKLVVAYLKLLRIPADLLAPRLNRLNELRMSSRTNDSEKTVTLTPYDFDCLIAAYDEYVQDWT